MHLPTTRAPGWVLSIAVGTLLAGCSGQPDRSAAITEPHRESVVAAARAGSTAGITVKSTDPSFGVQGESGKEVVISGSGFSPGDVAAWERNGVADPRIQVLRTSFVRSTQLLAVINIASDAELAKYDVSVMSADKGKGIGTEIFEVAKAFSDCGGQTTTDLVDSRIDLVWDDGANGVRSDGAGTYEGFRNGVEAKIFYYDAICSRSADAIFRTGGSRTAPRRLHLYFPEGSGLPTGGVAAEVSLNFIGLMRLGSDANGNGIIDSRDARIDAKNDDAPRAMEYPNTVAIRPDEYPNYGFHAHEPFTMSTDVRGCERLRFARIRLERTAGAAGYQLTGGTDTDGTPFAQWQAWMPGTWVVETVAPHEAQCFKSVKNSLVENGGPISMAFRVTITEQRER